MRTLFCLVAVLALSVQARSQDGPRFRGGVELVHVIATVTDGDGRFVTGLRQDDFRLYENGRPQVVSYFSQERAPVSLGILLDASGSMTPRKLDIARASINRLITDRLPADDELFFVEFAYNAAMTQEWTSDRALIRKALRDVERPTGDTRLYDAINFALPSAQEGRHAKKALLVISDGNDTQSYISARDLRTAVLDSDVLLYALGVDGEDARLGRNRLNADALRRLTDDTGGRTEVLRGFEGLDEALGRLAGELGAQYHLAYATDATGSGEWQSIRVEIDRRGARIRARNGYRR